MLRSFASIAVACAALLVFGAGRAHAGSFQVAPLSLTLSAKTPSGMLKLTNRGNVSMRLHVAAATWTEKADGNMELKPTTDIVFFPAMLTMKPGESRQLRVGVNVKPGATEKTYRLSIQELPALVTRPEDATTAVAVLTRMSVPVFVQGETAKALPAITGIEVKDGAVQFSVKNTGTAHFRSEKIVVRAKDSSSVVHTAEVDAWYVLAGGIRTYVVNLPEDACRSLNSIEIDLASNKGDAKGSLANAFCKPKP